MLRKALFRILIVLAVVVVLLTFLKVYYVRTEQVGYLFWNANHAYFFINSVDRGYRLSYLGLAGEVVQESLPFGVALPSDEHFSLFVLRLVGDSLQSYSANDFRLGGVEPLGGTLYVENMLNHVEFFRWSGDHFEPATADEQSRLQDAIRGGRIPFGPTYDHVEGWSKRTVAGDVIRNSPTDYTERDSKVTIELDGKSLTFAMNSGFITREPYIDLQRTGQAPERIWHPDEKAHRVSKSEYEHIFGNR